MGKIFLTSDTHFGHDKEFIWAPRGFKSVWEMNAAIVENWNETVSAEDDVYLLGDVMLGSNEPNGPGLTCLKQLKGNIHIVRGNHDSDIRIELYNKCWNVVEITEGQFLKYNGYHFYLSHYPCITDNHDNHKPLKTRMINLCGHRHAQNAFEDFDKGLIYHVELDTNNNKLWLLDDIIQNIKEGYKI